MEASVVSTVEAVATSPGRRGARKGLRCVQATAAELWAALLVVPASCAGLLLQLRNSFCGFGIGKNPGRNPQPIEAQHALQQNQVFEIGAGEAEGWAAWRGLWCDLKNLLAGEGVGCQAFG